MISLSLISRRRYHGGTVSRTKLLLACQTIRTGIYPVEFDIITHPVDKRENYIKRCIALPGDTLLISEGRVRVNGVPRSELPLQKFKYYVSTRGEPLPDPLLDSLKILKTSVTYNPVNSLHVLYLANENVESLRSFPQVRSISRYTEPTLSFQNQEIFPHSNLLPVDW